MRYYRANIENAGRRMKRIENFVLLLSILLLSSCALPNSPSSLHPMPTATTQPLYSSYMGPVNHPVTTTGCRQTPPVKPGTSATITIAASPAVSHGNRTRTYVVHVPITYQDTQPYAVILSFHGYGGTATAMDRSSGFTQLSEQQHFIAAYPQGVLDGIGKPFWASAGPIDFGIDDVLFVSHILDDLQKNFCVDPQRIFATGFSNGGGMTWLLSCRFAGRIAAFAPISGNFYAFAGGCHPGRPVPILDIHGTKDPLLPYNGIPASANPAWPLPSIPQWLQDWATRNGCASGPTVFLHAGNVIGEQWNGCPGNSAVVHYRIVGGVHTGPPPINGRSPAAVIWSFFQTHPLT